MTESHTQSADSPGADWIRTWIDQQREQLLRMFSETTGAGVGDFTHELAGRWLAASIACVRGLAQFAQSEPGDVRSAGAQLNEEMFNAWQGGMADANAAAREATQYFLDALGRMPPLGLAREHMESWRELAAAQRRCQELEQALRLELVRVQEAALRLLEARLRERDAAGTPIAGWRELYDLWVECGEQAYAQTAHSETYARLQAELGNAAVRLRARTQSILERALKQADLPTRSELNTVHRQLRELRARLAALEAGSANKTSDER